MQITTHGGTTDAADKPTGVVPIVSSAFVRPRRVIIKYTDPFDGTWVGTSDYAYDPRLSADGFYSRGVKIMRDGLKKIQSHILEGRTPKVNVSLVA